MEIHSGTEGGDMHVTKTNKGEAGTSLGALWEHFGHMYMLRMLLWTVPRCKERANIDARLISRPGS